MGPMAKEQRHLRPICETAITACGTESWQTPRWSGMDTNFQYAREFRPSSPRTNAVRSARGASASGKVQILHYKQKAGSRYRRSPQRRGGGHRKHLSRAALM